MVSRFKLYLLGQHGDGHTSALVTHNISLSHPLLPSHEHSNSPGAPSHRWRGKARRGHLRKDGDATKRKSPCFFRTELHSGPLTWLCGVHGWLPQPLLASCVVLGPGVQTRQTAYPGLKRIPMGFPSIWVLRMQPHLEMGSLQTSFVQMRSRRIR